MKPEKKDYEERKLRKLRSEAKGVKHRLRHAIVRVNEKTPKWRGSREGKGSKGAYEEQGGRVAKTRRRAVAGFLQTRICRWR